MSLTLRHVVRAVGGVAIAEYLGVHKQTITNWVRSHRQINAAYAIKLQELTGIPAQYFLVDQGLEKIEFSREVLERLDKLASKK